MEEIVYLIQILRDVPVDELIPDEKRLLFSNKTISKLANINTFQIGKTYIMAKRKQITKMLEKYFDRSSKDELIVLISAIIMGNAGSSVSIRVKFVRSDLDTVFVDTDTQISLLIDYGNIEYKEMKLHDLLATIKNEYYKNINYDSRFENL